MDRSWKDYGTILAMSLDPGQKCSFVFEHLSINSVLSSLLFYESDPIIMQLNRYILHSTIRINRHARSSVIQED